MNHTLPGVTIEHYREKSGSYDGDFSTLFLYFAADLPSGRAFPLTRPADLLKIKELEGHLFLRNCVDTFFKNGGDLLYILIYRPGSVLDLNAFGSFLTGECDRLIDVEVVAAVNLYDTSLTAREIIQVQRIINDYCERSDRISLSDIGRDFEESYLDLIGRTVIYHPWIIDSRGYLLPPSVYAAALLSKMGNGSEFFRSIANRELVNTQDTNEVLDEYEAAEQVAKRINPVLNIPHRGVRLWGIKTFDHNVDTLNELRVLKLVKRKLRRISKMFIFEPNDVILEAKIQFLVTLLLEKLVELGALSGYEVNPATDEYEEGDRIVIEIALGFSAALEYIRIRLEKVENEEIRIQTI